MSSLLHILISKNILSESDYCNSNQLMDDKAFFDYLISNNTVNYDVLASILFEEYRISSVNLSGEIINDALIYLIPHNIADKYKVLPIKSGDGELSIAMANPFDYIAIENIELITLRRVSTYFMPPDEINILISKLYSNLNIDRIVHNFLADKTVESINPTDREKTMTADIQEAPAVKIVNQILESAASLNASDIHIEPQEFFLRVRYRVDGELIEVQKINNMLHTFIVSRIKVMSDLDIAEKRLPQEGHFKQKINNINIDFRVSTLPTIFGEKIAVRLIYNNLKSIHKTKLGFLQEDLNKINNFFKNTHGVVLITGPTGSGKSTTLLSFIDDINKQNKNIVTIEDPVENILTGVNQISINPKNGFDFADALRIILRQDPDIIMVGEIRGSDTAVLAIRAAMTGHLVLSTLHTNDSVSAVSRLIDMGVPSYLVASTIRGIISQRLVRRLCSLCKSKTTISEQDALIFKLPRDTAVYEHRGCVSCNNTGFTGRFAVYEILTIDNKLKNLINQQVTCEEIKFKLKESGMKFMYENVAYNVLQGNTTISEMYKTVYEF